MAWEPPASDFFPVVSRELQAERDTAANQLRMEVDPTSNTLEQDRLLMQQKAGGKYPDIKELRTKATQPLATWSPPEEDFKAAAWEPPAEDFMTTMDAASQALHKGAQKLDEVGPSITDKVAAASGMVYPWTVGMFSGIAAGVESGINLGQYGLGRLFGRPEASNEELKKELSHHPNAELIDKALKKLMPLNDNKSFEAGAAFSGAPIDAAFAALEHKTGPLGKASAEVAMVLAPFLHGRGGKVQKPSPENSLLKNLPLISLNLSSSRRLRSLQPPLRTRTLRPISSPCLVSTISRGRNLRSTVMRSTTIPTIQI